MNEKKATYNGRRKKGQGHTCMHAMCNNVYPLLSGSFMNSVPTTAAAKQGEKKSKKAHK